MDSTRHNHSRSAPAEAVLVNGASPLPRRILVVEDDAEACRRLQQLLRLDPALHVETACDGAQALLRLDERNYSIVITDLRMPGLDGMQLIEEIQGRRLPVTVIVTTGETSIDEAVKAMQMGAYHFLTKPLDHEHLRLVVQRALNERELQDAVTLLREQLQERFSFQNIISKSPRMHAIFDLIGNLAHTTTTVLIEGETGTGKEMVARAIHAVSKGRFGPIVAVNCAALPEHLLESELFGHEKGAFTGAIGQRRGRFEVAHGGTIFLDEVGDIPAAMQAKLLRVLQDKRFERVGGMESIMVDVRVVAATNRPLQRLVRRGDFRDDLFYRLHVVRIELPPLRDRVEDIPLLAAHFCEKYGRPGTPPKQINPEAMELLLNCPWPGNVRQLENVIERACVTSSDCHIRPENLPPEVKPSAVRSAVLSVNLTRPLPDLIHESICNLEEQYIRKALRKVKGNVGKAARICGMSRRSVSAKIAEYKIDKAEYKRGA